MSLCGIPPCCTLEYLCSVALSIFQCALLLLLVFTASSPNVHHSVSDMPPCSVLEYFPIALSILRCAPLCAACVCVTSPMVFWSTVTLSTLHRGFIYPPVLHTQCLPCAFEAFWLTLSTVVSSTL
eukprot:scaffold46489_cov21-Tisochrysis_lutea.AAC.2